VARTELMTLELSIWISTSSNKLSLAYRWRPSLVVLLLAASHHEQL